MRVYIACHSAELARTHAVELEAVGHAVASTWHAVESVLLPADSFPEAERREIAGRDTAEVLAADALLLVAGPDKYSGGKFVEAGIAIGAGKPVYVLGRRENMLLWGDAVTQVDSVGEMAGR